MNVVKNSNCKIIEQDFQTSPRLKLSVVPCSNNSLLDRLIKIKSVELLIENLKGPQARVYKILRHYLNQSVFLLYSPKHNNKHISSINNCHREIFSCILRSWLQT